MHEQWTSSPNSRFVTPFYELPRFPSPDPVSPRLIKRVTGLNSSLGVRGLAQDALELLVLGLASDVHEASALVSININCLTVADVTLERVRRRSSVPYLLFCFCSRENLKTSCGQQPLNPRVGQGRRTGETVKGEAD